MQPEKFCVCLALSFLLGPKCKVCQITWDEAQNDQHTNVESDTSVGVEKFQNICNRHLINILRETQLLQRPAAIAGNISMEHNAESSIKCVFEG